MKSIFFIVLACVVGFGNCFAQTSNFSIGPKVGLNFSNVNEDNTDYKLGFNAGLTSTYSVNESSGIGLDILYARQGYKFNDINTNFDYLKFPLTYKLFFNKLGDAFRPRIELGFSPALLLSAKTEGFDIKDQLNSFDIGLLGGFGFNYRLSDRLWLNFDVRGDIGLTDISKTNNDETKNSAISVNVGVAAGL